MSNCYARTLTTLALGALALAGCRETTSVLPQPNAAVALTQFPGGCGAQYVATITEDDNEVSGLDMPTTTTEESAVCETWTGNDYTYQIHTSSESDADPEIPPDSVRGATFSSGLLTPTDNLGQATGTSVTIDPTTFDLQTASASEEQASYDDPYYGIYTGCPPPQIICDPPNALMVDDSASRNAATDPLTRHGVARRGVRALIANGVEISRSALGDRRFRVRQTDADIIYSVDPTTDLLVAQELSAPNVSVVARYQWRRTLSGFVKERTDITQQDVRNGIPIVSRSSVTISNLSIDGYRVQ